MRILHLSKYYHPFRGGIEKVIKELSEASIALGHEVTVICSSQDYSRHEETINGVHVIRWPRLFSLFSQPVTPTVFTELKNFVDNYDVIQLHTPNPLMEFALLKLELKKPLIVTYHCEVLRKTPLNGFYEKVAQDVLKRAETVVVATQEHVKYSKFLNAVSEKCVTIPFGIQERWSRRSLEMNDRLKDIKSKYPRYFLFIGRMVTYKGVNILLEAMKSVDAQLLLIGKGPRLKQWKNLKEDFKLENRVTFLDQVEADLDFAAYIYGADALVLPSINEAEAFGLVLLEAMSCGKPVITTDLKSGVRFVNQSGVTGLSVPPGDARALAQAMNTMHTNNDLRIQMGENARKHFEAHFTLDQFVNSYMRLYQDLGSKQNVA